MPRDPLRFVIIGGVAGGASAAARARRLSEDALITIIERGADVSFANCGLPYYIGGEISDRSKLTVHTTESLKRLLNIEIRTDTEAMALDRGRKTVLTRGPEGRDVEVPYDKLLLSPGASPLRPELPGISDPRIMVLRTLRDMDRIKEATGRASRFIIIGGGFIGLEMAEMLVRLEKRVVLIQSQDQVLTQMDPEMTRLIERELTSSGVELILGDGVAGFSGDSKQVTARLASGREVHGEAVILSIGIRCESALAAAAGLEVGARGSIRVNEFLQTADPDIYAVGDAVETRDPILGKRVVVPLGGPANRQGRVVADHIFLGEKAAPYPGSLGTAIVRVFDTVAAVTGYTEKRLIQEQVPYRFAIVTGFQHAGYYPGAVPLVVKILWNPDTGVLLGGQAVGPDGVDKRIDVLSTAITGRLTIDDLCHLDLAYAPPFGSAKDVLNIAGFAAQNMQKGLLKPALDLPKNGQSQILDVRAPELVSTDPIPGAISIPIENLRNRLGELDRNKPVVTICALGKTSYFAHRILAQHGFETSAVIGGWSMSSQRQATTGALRGMHGGLLRQEGTAALSREHALPLELDTCGLSCPGPILKIKEVLPALAPGQRLIVQASDPGFANDFPAYCEVTGLEFLGMQKNKGIFVAQARQRGEGGQRAGQLSARPGSGATLVVFSCDLDRALAAFIVATGAAALGGPVTMFFTFWGLNILRTKDAPGTGKGLLDTLFSKMLPQGIDSLGLSRFHFGGLGTLFMKSRMKSRNLPNLPMLVEEARKAKIRLVACSMSMDAMGISREEMIEGVEIGGVADFLAACQHSNTHLFI